MSIFKFFTFLLSVISLCLSGSKYLEMGYYRIKNPMIVVSEINNKSNKQLRNMTLTTSLLPYEILAGQATSYADLTLTISNSSLQKIEIIIKRIEIVNVESNKVLMDSVNQNFDLPEEILLKSQEIQTLDYRLISQGNVYQQDQKVLAKVYYHDSVLDTFTVSNPETVAFMIP